MKNLNKIEAILAAAGAQKRSSLSEPEVYSVLELAGLGAPAHALYPLPVDCAAASADICARLAGGRAVIKLVSSKTLHKTEAGGVKVVDKNPADLQQALAAMSKAFPEAEALMAVEFLPHSAFALGEELLLGARSDDAFGPLITLGPGGTHAEAFIKALKTGLAPSVMPVELAHNKVAWDKFLAGSWIWKYCAGRVRGGKRLAEDAEMLKWLEGFTALMSHFRDGGASAWAIEEFEINPLAVSNGRLTALDGVLRFRPARNKARSKPSKNGVGALLAPASVAVLGVSEKKMNMGRIILNNVIKFGFPREHVYVVKPGLAELDGVKCVASAADFPETIDMYVVAVPSPDVPQMLAEAAGSGKVRGVVLISGGMGEKAGSEDVGRKVVETILNGRKKNPDFALSGGNSMGIVLNGVKVDTFFIPEYKLEHPLGVNPNIAKTAFVSQSGAFVISAESRMPWLKPAYSITVGNQQDVTVVDYLDRLAEEASLKVLLVYMEGFKYGDGLALAKVIEKARKNGKQVVLYKAGRTAVGQKAVMGHTASIAGDYLVSSLILKKAGALVAETFDDFNDYALLACHFAGFKTPGRNTFFLTNAGFEAAGMADSLNGPLTADLTDPELKAAMEKVLKEARLDSIVDVKNPLDITPMAGDAPIGALVEKALAHRDFGGVMVSMVPLTAAMNTLPAGPGSKEDLALSFLKASVAAARKAGKPLVFCVAAGPLYDPYCQYALKLGLPVFRSADRAVKMYSDYVEFANS